MSGRLWLILFLLTVAIGVTVWMSSGPNADLPPPEEALQEGEPLRREIVPKHDSPFVAPPTKAEKEAMRKAEAEGTGLEPNALPGPGEPSAIAPPTTAPPSRKDEVPTLQDGVAAPVPGNAQPPPASAFPPPAYPPPVYDSGPAGPGNEGGFEGDIPPPPPADGGPEADPGFMHYDPDAAPPMEDGGF